MTRTESPSKRLPVLIIGAGISGLLLAQQLRTASVPFQIFERDDEHRTRGTGWGLTLQWSLPALRELLSKELLAQLCDIYVDRVSVERGEVSRFPFFDLSTGELKNASPKLPEDQRIRVLRERLCKLLATGVTIQWGKTFTSFERKTDSVVAVFEDGSKVNGRMIVGCDGSHSQVRRSIAPTQSDNEIIPVRLFGFVMEVSAEEARPIRDLDPFFLQGTASASNTFMYTSLLEAPMKENYESGTFIYQICISWNANQADSQSSSYISLTNKERVGIVRDLVKTWAEPFRSFVSRITDSTHVKLVNLDDFVPRAEVHSSKNVFLLGDAFHAMAMYRGEGANHSIVDVLDFNNKILPQLLHHDRSMTDVQLSTFTNDMVTRTRPAVLASRRACLDAHDWQRLTPASPLLSKRQMYLEFDG